MSKEVIQRSFSFLEEIVPQLPQLKERKPVPAEYSFSLVNPPTLEELIGRLTKRRRCYFGKWIETTQTKFSLEDILPPKKLLLLHLCLFPQPPDNQLFDLKEVAAQIFGRPQRQRALKRNLQMAMVRIIRRERYGPRSLEVLNLSDEPNDFLYQKLVTHFLPDGQRMITIDQLATLSTKELQIICGARPMFAELKRKMKRYFPDWNPPVVFRQELPADKAYYY